MLLSEPIVWVSGAAVAVTAAWLVYGIRAARKRVIYIALTLMLTSGLVAAGFAPGAFAASTLYPNPSPGAAEVTNSQLPSCAGTSGTKADQMAGQGWVGDWQMPMQIGLRNGWSVLMIPCFTNGVGTQIIASTWVLNDSGAFTPVATKARIALVRMTCNGVVRTNTSVPIEAGGGIANSTLGTWDQAVVAAPAVTGYCLTPTDRIGQITVNWSVNFNGNLVLGTATWRPQAWGDGTPITKPTSVGTIPNPAGGETAVLCPYAIDSTDILSSVSSFFQTFGPWFACLFIPAGWDRAGQIPQSFELSGVSRLGDVVTAGIPLAGSIYCGEVATLPIWGSGVPINTCPLAAVVPGFVKIAMASMIILGLALLFFRRFQWTVQS